MAASHWVNGLDPEADLGIAAFLVSPLRDWMSGLDHNRDIVSIPNRFASIAAPDADTRPRLIQLRYSLEAPTIAQRRTDLSKLADLFPYGGLIDLSFADAPERVITGTVAKTGSVSAFGALELAAPVQPIIASFDILCLDPTYRDQRARPLAFDINRTSVPLGNLPIDDAVIVIMGSATNPTITHRDSQGKVITTMPFTVTLGSADYLVIDCGLRKLTRYTSGVSDSSATVQGYLTGTDFITLDPLHGSYANSVWPTLELSQGAGVLWYRRRWGD